MILFYYGEDSFTLLKEIKKLKAEFVSANPAAGIEEISVDKDVADSSLRNLLIETLQTQGLFAAKKLVILKNFLTNIKAFRQSEEYLLDDVVAVSKPSPHPSTGAPSPEQGEGNIVVFTQSEKFDGRIKFFKALKKYAQTKEFNVPAGHDLENWIKDYLGNQGFEIEHNALGEFIRLLGQNEDEQMYDLWQVSSELEKLTLLQSPPSLSPSPQGGGKIGLSDVRQLVIPNISQNIFALTNLFAEGKGREAMSLLEKMMSTGQAAELKTQIIQIIGGLASQIRSLLLVKDLENQVPAKIAETLGWKEGRVWINSKLAKNFTKEKLLGLMRDLRALDLRLKTSEEPPKLLLSLFLQKAKT